VPAFWKPKKVLESTNGGRKQALEAMRERGLQK